MRARPESIVVCSMMVCADVIGFDNTCRINLLKERQTLLDSMRESIVGKKPILERLRCSGWALYRL